MHDEPIDLSALDPARDEVRWRGIAARVADRGRELRTLRRTVARRGAVALVVAAAAGLALWLSAPAPQPDVPANPSLLDWATRDVSASDVLALGAGHAQ